MTLYNVMYTSMPVLLLSITEKPYLESQLLKNPSLYQENAGNIHLTWKYFMGWITLSIYHSLVVYFFGYMMFNTNSMVYKQYTTDDLFSYGTFMIHNVVFVVTIRLWLIARYQTIVFTLSIVGSVAAFIASTIVYNEFSVFSSPMYKVYDNLLSEPVFWISNALICVAALLPDYVIIALKMFNIKVRPTETISDGWNRLRNRDSKNKSTNSNRESTYL